MENKRNGAWPWYLLLTLLILVICFLFLSLFYRPVTGTVTAVDTYRTNEGSYSVIQLETEKQPDTFLMDDWLDERPWEGDLIEVNFTYGDYFHSLFLREIPICNEWKELPGSEEEE